MHYNALRILLQCTTNAGLTENITKTLCELIVKLRKNVHIWVLQTNTCLCTISVWDITFMFVLFGLLVCMFCTMASVLDTQILFLLSGRRKITINHGSLQFTIQIGREEKKYSVFDMQHLRRLSPNISLITDHASKHELNNHFLVPRFTMLLQCSKLELAVCFLSLGSEK